MENNGTEDMISSVSTREASIKVKALNQATIKMARKIESLEEENTTLKEKNELVCIYMYVISLASCLWCLRATNDLYSHASHAYLAKNILA